LVIFILYIVLPIQTPDFLAIAIDSSLGMLSIFIITVYLFFHVNPILAVVYIFVAYELLRRSSLVTGRTAIVMNTPSQERKDDELQEMNPPPIFFPTLEEEVVSKMAPIGKSEPSVYQQSSFSPVSDKLIGGSVM
jgi:hypothetical protein